LKNCAVAAFVTGGQVPVVVYRGSWRQPAELLHVMAGFVLRNRQGQGAESMMQVSCVDGGRQRVGHFTIAKA